VHACWIYHTAISGDTKSSTNVKYRCDYCGGHLGLIVDRYYRMRFCCKAHMSAYKQRLTMETRAKIRQLELLAPT
jgi:hypothetical protein